MRHRKTLNASITVEAAIIVPLFTLIIVQMIILAINCHDVAMSNIIETKMVMKVEYEAVFHGKVNEDIRKKIQLDGNKVLEIKSIGKRDEVKIEKTIFDVKSQHSQILLNNPVEFVRITDAAKIITNGKK